MTIAELKILLDLNLDSKKDVLKEHAKKFNLGYFFVDSETGRCHLFDRNGNEDDVSKVKKIQEELIDKKTLTKIAIPASVTRIGFSAFAYCRGLTSVTIPNSVTSIGWEAFTSCNELTSATIGNGVMSIGDWAFEYCSKLTNVMIPASLTSIGEYTFNGCSGLTSVTIPDSVTSIGKWAFAYCSNLKSLVFKGKTLKQVKAMNDYPWKIKDESIIKCET